MNSRERIEAIFRTESPDRVGRYEQSVYSSVASRVLGRRAFTAGTSLHRDEAEAWLRSDAAHDEFVETLYRDKAEIGRVLKFDMLGMPWRMTARPAKKTGNNEYLYGDPDGEWFLYRFDPESETFGLARTSRPAESLDDLRRAVDDSAKSLADSADAEPDYVPYLKRLVNDFGDTLAVLGSAGISIPLNEEWLTAVALDPGLVGAYLDVQLEYAIRDVRRQAAIGVKIIWGGGDFADNAGPVYGPKAFRDLLLPRLKRLMNECHNLGLWCVFRSDGNLWSVTDMMFEEAGIDGYGEIDWAAGMDLADLKRRYPRVTFWGNVPPPLIRNDSKTQVLAAAKHCIDSVPDRRLILGSSNSILPGTPLENLFALTEAVDLYGAR